MPSNVEIKQGELKSRSQMGFLIVIHLKSTGVFSCFSFMWGIAMQVEWLLTKNLRFWIVDAQDGSFSV